MKSQLWQLIIIQFKEHFREPGALFWSFAFPILMAWGLGVAFSSKDQITRQVAVVQEKISADSRLTQFLLNQTKAINPSSEGHKQYEKVIKNPKLGSTIYRFIVVKWDEAIIYLKRGNVAVILDDNNDSIRFHFDPNNPEAQLVYLQLNSLNKHHGLLEDASNIQTMTKIGTRYIDFLIPGLLAMGIMSSCLWGISYGMIEKRSKKLLRRMVATPMNKSFFMISQFVSRLVLSFAEAFILILFAYLTFHISIQGSIPALLLVFLTGNFVFIGIGILISSRTASTQTGNGLISAVTMPMMVLSGIFFSYYNFPHWIIPVIQKMPLTIFADSIRSIFIEGAGMMAMLPNILFMLSIGLVSFVIGLKIFKWY